MADRYDRSPLARARNRRTGRAARVAPLVGLLVFGLGGCVSLPSDRTVTDEDWTPASADALGQWLERYDQVLARAARTSQGEQLDAVTGNVQYHSVRAEHRLAEQGGPDPTVVTHQDPRFHLPAFDDYPLHGLAVSTDQESGRTVLDLIDRQSAGSDWRSLVSVRLDDGQQLPELELDGDHPVQPPLNEPGELRRSPAQMARAFGGLLAATGKDSPFAVFGSDPLVDEHLARNAEYDAAQNNGQVTKEHEPADPMAVRAFSTSDGGALVLAGLREEMQLQVHGGEIALREDAATYTDGPVTAGNTASVTYFWQVAFVQPAASAGDDARPEILGVQRVLGEVQVAAG